ncbi:MAG: hypothetical protein QOJ73_4483 [Streptosporangiaceae bacterium]|jgi:hypothetical protein|nr:hypothetical protein [Streptosporangiaceae bacterium]
MDDALRASGMMVATPRHVDLGAPISFDGGDEAVWVGEAQDE